MDTNKPVKLRIFEAISLLTNIDLMLIIIIISSIYYLATFLSEANLSNEEIPSETFLEDIILVDPEECILICNGSITRNSSDEEICQDSTIENKIRMCSNWRNEIREVNPFPEVRPQYVISY